MPPKRISDRTGLRPFSYSFFSMNKKVYLAPKTRSILIETNAILAYSGTGATGEDIPWARAKSRNRIFDDEFDFGEE